MGRRLPPVNWLRAFEAAARHVSFTGAAAELGVTASAVSQQVRHLEQHLGRVLFHRLPRSLKLSTAGEAYLPLVREAFERLAAGTAELFGDRSGDRLAVRTTTAFARFWLGPRLPRFIAAHPGTDLHLSTTIWPSALPDPDLDLEIRYGTGAWPGLTAIRLTWDAVFPVCSPALRDGHDGRPPLARPADLDRHTLLHTIGFREGWADWLRRAGAADRVDAGRGLEFDTAVMAIELATRGAGVALGRTCFVEDLLATGQLVAPFDFALPTDEAFHAVAPKGRTESAAAVRFGEWLQSEAPAGRVAGDANGR